MMSIDQFEALAQDVARLNGISEDLALAAVAAAGDTPETNDAGQVVVTVGLDLLTLIWPESDDE